MLTLQPIRAAKLSRPASRRNYLGCVLFKQSHTRAAIGHGPSTDGDNQRAAFMGSPGGGIQEEPDGGARDHKMVRLAAPVCKDDEAGKPDLQEPGLAPHAHRDTLDLSALPSLLPGQRG